MSKLHHKQTYGQIYEKRIRNITTTRKMEKKLKEEKNNKNVFKE
jgi:hypothetical protein